MARGNFESPCTVFLRHGINALGILAMPTVLRFSVYTFVVLILAALLPAAVDRLGIGVFRENGPIEWLQFGLIVTVGAVFVVAALVRSPLRQLIVLLAGVTALAGFRELDALLDESIPGVGWKAGFAVFVGASVWGYRNKQVLKPQFSEFFTTRAFAVLWAGFLVALPIAQLVGHGPLLRVAMGGYYVFEYKHMIEEILELMGYLMLLIGSIELTTQLGPVGRGDQRIHQIRDKSESAFARARARFRAPAFPLRSAPNSWVRPMHSRTRRTK